MCNSYTIRLSGHPSPGRPLVSAAHVEQDLALGALFKGAHVLGSETTLTKGRGLMLVVIQEQGLRLRPHT